MGEVIKVDENFLNLSEGIHVAESIKKIRWEDYLPQESSENFNKDLALNIRIDNVDNYVLLEDSSFIFDIELQKTSDSSIITTGDIALTNNALMYLFDRVQLRFDDRAIEEFSCAGQVTTIQGLLNYNAGFSHSRGHSQCWSVDQHDYSAAQTTNEGFHARKDMLFTAHTQKGKCRFVIPFNHIFGFRGKILSGVRVSVQFHRRDNADSVYKSAAQASNADVVSDGKIVIKSFKWKVAYIDLNVDAASRIMSYLSQKPKILYKFKTKQVEEFIVNTTKILDKTLGTVSGPQKILGMVVCFQTDRSNSQKANASIFDHVKVLDGQVSLNNEQYPGEPLNCRSSDGSYMECYNRFLKFRELFTDGYAEVSPLDFIQAYPLYCFDTSQQEQRLNGSTVSVKLHFKFQDNVPANTTCYVVIFRETVMTVSTLGDRKMEIQEINTF